MAKLVVVMSLAAMLVACGGEQTSTTTATDGPSSELGAVIVQRAGCGTCHGVSGQGGVGPAWVDLAGSQVELSDGSVVVADDGYLFESIRDPGATRVAGYNVQMPGNSLSDEEIRDVVVYIRSLSVPP